jgi:regulator of cell morphogenesis and NO signaling
MIATAERTVAELVTEKPARSKVFERHGIDFCCGGKTRLADACATRGVPVDSLVDELLALDVHHDEVNPDMLSLPELIDDIVITHHHPLITELPRLTRMAARVAHVHGDHDDRLASVADAVRNLWDELTAHMANEEQVLFPMIRTLAEVGRSHESVAATIDALEQDHDDAGNILSQLRRLSDNYTPPEWACNTYRALLDGLRELERDLHTHIHKENNILFPKALQLELRLG